MTEEWKAVVGFEGHYEVSDRGRVRSLTRVVPHGRGSGMRHQKGRMLTLNLTGSRRNYCSVTLRIGKRVEYWRVHRLVLTAFVGPCPEGMVGCHNDDNSLNNTLSNLRWDTEVANAQDRIRNGKDYGTGLTHCQRGHAFDEANTLWKTSSGNGRRECWTCRHMREVRYGLRKAS